MAYSTDGNGNYYIGQFAQEINFSYNSSNFILNNSAATLQTDLTTIFGLLNYRFSAFFGSWVNGTLPVANANGIDWKTANDPITTLVKRFRFLVYSDGSAPGAASLVFYNDNGITIDTQVSSSTSANGTIYQSYIVNQYGMTVISHTTSSLTVPSYQIGTLTELIDVNTTIPTNSSVPYYSGFYKNKLLLLRKASLTTIEGEHRIEQTNTSNKPILLTADAVYGITCSDGQTAGTDLWMTKLHVFDNTSRSNGVSSKYSRIGTVPNLAIGIGTSWIIGRMYAPATNLFPGNNNKWLCVGNWNNLANRFVLVNVWSV
jgi:hypothetical protein